MRWRKNILLSRSHCMKKNLSSKIPRIRWPSSHSHNISLSFLFPFNNHILLVLHQPRSLHERTDNSSSHIRQRTVPSSGVINENWLASSPQPLLLFTINLHGNLVTGSIARRLKPRPLIGPAKQNTTKRVTGGGQLSNVDINLLYNADSEWRHIVIVWGCVHCCCCNMQTNGHSCLFFAYAPSWNHIKSGSGLCLAWSSDREWIRGEIPGINRIANFMDPCNTMQSIHTTTRFSRPTVRL